MGNWLTLGRVKKDLRSGPEPWIFRAENSEAFRTAFSLDPRDPLTAEEAVFSLSDLVFTSGKLQGEELRVLGELRNAAMAVLEVENDQVFVAKFAPEVISRFGEKMVFFRTMQGGDPIEALGPSVTVRELMGCFSEGDLLCFDLGW